MTRPSGLASGSADGRFAAIVLLMALLTLNRLGASDVCGGSEAAMAVYVQQMVEDHRLLFPLDNCTIPMYKPPLYHWTATGLAHLLREDTATPFNLRLPSALYAIGGAMLTMALAMSLLGPRGAILAGLILCGSYQYISQARIGLVDMTLTFCETLALFTLFCVVYERARRTGASPQAHVASLFVCGGDGLGGAREGAGRRDSSGRRDFDFSGDGTGLAGVASALQGWSVDSWRGARGGLVSGLSDWTPLRLPASSARQRKLRAVLRQPRRDATVVLRQAAVVQLIATEPVRPIRDRDLPCFRRGMSFNVPGAKLAGNGRARETTAPLSSESNPPASSAARAIQADRARSRALRRDSWRFLAGRQSHSSISRPSNVALTSCPYGQLQHLCSPGGSPIA